MIALPVLLNLLNKKYLNNYDTILIGGFNEPFYKAFKADKCAEIQFTRNYIRSALHELSHWCVAGTERRKVDDFGYWYAADGRNQQQQDEFFKVEVKPQAIEWAFSIIGGVKFEASVDNLLTSVAGVDSFNKNLINQLKTYIKEGFSLRVSSIIQLIAHEQEIKNPMAFIGKQIDTK